MGEYPECPPVGCPWDNPNWPQFPLNLQDERFPAHRLMEPQCLSGFRNYSIHPDHTAEPPVALDVACRRRMLEPPALLGLGRLPPRQPLTTGRGADGQPKVRQITELVALPAELVPLLVLLLLSLLLLSLLLLKYS